MSDRQTCVHCGIESYAVSTRIVRRDPTPDDPTEYRAESRCADVYACRDRADAREETA